jgi:hypothetical protein
MEFDGHLCLHVQESAVSSTARGTKMAEVTTTYNGKSVKDVPAQDFIDAFSSYLKSTGKVCATDGVVQRRLTAGLGSGVCISGCASP